MQRTLEPMVRTASTEEEKRMMTVQEIEAACDAQQPPNFTRHMLQTPELTERAVFYPLGFPAEVRTNSEMILDQFALLWSMFEKRFDTKTIVAEVQVVETESTECPPAPVYRYMPPALTAVADANNFCFADFSQGRTWIVVSTAALRYPLYLRHFFLECAAGGHIATNYVPPALCSRDAESCCAVILARESHRCRTRARAPAGVMCPTMPPSC